MFWSHFKWNYIIFYRILSYYFIFYKISTYVTSQSFAVLVLKRGSLLHFCIKYCSDLAAKESRLPSSNKFYKPILSYLFLS